MTTSPSVSSLIPSRPIYWTMVALCVTAAAISGYLAYTAFTMGEVAGCGGGLFDCDHVLTSKFSKIAGIPVSVPAFSLYFSMLVGLSFLRSKTPEPLQRAVWMLLAIGSLSAATAAIWFAGLQHFVLGHYCIYCLCAHGCGLTLAGIVLWKAPLRWSAISGFASMAAVCVVGIAVTQWQSEEPQLFTEKRFDTPPTEQVSDSDTFAPPVEFSPPGEEFAPPVFAPPGAAVESETSIVEFTPPLSVDVDDDSSEIRQVVMTEVDLQEAEILPAEVEEVGCEEEPVPEPIDSEKPSTDEPLNTTQLDAEPSFQASTNAAAWLFFPAGTQRLAARLFFDDKAKADTEKPSGTADKGEKSKVVQKPKANLALVQGNAFSLNTRHWPLLGDPDAKYVFVEMFDYTCQHCRRTHKAIDGAFKKYGDDLAVIVLPVPLEKACNPKAVGAGHVGACELARIAIAVWRVDQKKFREFHKWMCEQSRQPATARAHAEKLVGQAAFRAEMSLPHAKNYVKKHVELYGKVGSGTVPKLMFPEAVLEGAVTDAGYLVKKIQTELVED